MTDNINSWHWNWRSSLPSGAVPPAVISFWLPTLLVLLALALYANSFPGAFILDDQLIVVNNSLVQHPDLITIFRADYWHGVNHSGLFRPLTILSLALNRMLFGPAPLGFHLVNVLLHAAVTLLLWRGLLVWGVPLFAATTSAVLFAAHPLHTEVINEVVGRSELLAAFFLLAAFNFARSRRASAPLWVCLCYLLALLAKEHAVTFLLLLPLAEAFVAASPGLWRRRWPLYLGLAAVAALWLCWRQFGVPNHLPQIPLSVAAAPLAYVDPLTRGLTALHLQWLYIGKLFLPHGLQAVYSLSDLPPFIRSFFSIPALLVVGGSSSLLVLLAWGWQRRSPLALFALLYLLAFLPTANLLFPIGVTFAERLAYFPSLWFCAGLGVLFAAGLRVFPSSRPWMWLLLLVYVLYLGGMTWARNPDFASEQRLWRAEVANNPADFVGWLNLAESLLAAGDMDAADKAYRSMLAVDPDDPTGVRSRMAFYLVQGDYAQALAIAQKGFAQAQSQGDIIAMAFDGRSLAEAYLGKGECDKALSYLEGPALPLRNQPQTIKSRLAVLSCLGRDDEVVAELAGMEKGDMPGWMQHQYGFSLMRTGRLTEARVQLEQVVKEATTNAEAWNLLGVICGQRQDRAAAIAAFARAAALVPGDAIYRDNLQQARLEGGRDGE